MVCKRNTTGGLQNMSKERFPTIFIEKVHGYYVFTSVIDALNKILLNNLLFPYALPTSAQVNAVWDKGCYVTDTQMRLINMQYHGVFGAFQSKHNNSSSDNDFMLKLAILFIFFPVEALRSNKILPKPIITHVSNTQKGGDTFRYVSSDPRRAVISVLYPKLQNNKHLNYGRFVLKIANNQGYSDAYRDEADIYKFFRTNNESQDIVKYYNSGIIGTDPIKVDHVNELEITALPKLDLFTNKFFILLEDTYEYMDYQDFVSEELLESKYDPSRSVSIQSALSIITNKIKIYNDKYGFVHGDLHSGNVKIKRTSLNSFDVKLFDFDFSAILKPTSKIIARNLRLYNLKFNDEIIFDLSNPQLPPLNFFFVFDYFRLWLSVTKILIQSEDTLISFNESPSSKLQSVLSAWFVQHGTERADWNDYFSENYFYSHIYTMYSPATHESHVNQHIPALSLEEQLDRLKNLRLNNQTSSFISSSFLSSEGGDRKQKKTLAARTPTGREKLSISNKKNKKKHI